MGRQREKRGGGRKGVGEKKKEENLQHSPLHHVHSEESAGRMPWTAEEAERVLTVLPPCSFLIPSAHTHTHTHTAPELYSAPNMRLYYSVELHTAA